MFVYAVVAEMLKEKEEFHGLRYRHRHSIKPTRFGEEHPSTFLPCSSS